MTIRKTYGPKIKAKIALDAVNEEKTIFELSSHYEVHPSQVRSWKNHLIKHVDDIFGDKSRITRYTLTC